MDQPLAAEKSINVINNIPSDLTHVFQTGTNDFLSKPFYAEELIARVSNQLKLVELQRVDLDNARLRDQIAGDVEADHQLRAATQQLLEGISAGIIAFI